MINEKIKKGLTVLGIVGSLGGLSSTLYFTDKTFDSEAGIKYYSLKGQIKEIERNYEVPEKRPEYRQLQEDLYRLVSSSDGESQVHDYKQSRRIAGVSHLVTAGLLIPTVIGVCSYMKRRRKKNETGGK